ncbi:MAG: tRNA(Ile)(2)-agmatinylcytidine synthase [Thermoplasmata archaeon]|nr:tRNA(Ile)(2)-agmatinylcytidine synthase [Thermoplasmata archaeon]
MLYIGIDDTDAIGGMCTTYLMTEVVRIIEKHGLSVIGYPRLVRLNPSVPWKTRGNAALSIAAGIGSGKKWVCGEYGGVAFSARETGESPSPEIERKIIEDVTALVETRARFEEENTNPGVVFLRKRPDYRFYIRGVREILSKEEVEREIAAMDGIWKGYKNGRGIIGAFCAIAWRPYRCTYEILAYRKEENWGTERRIDEASVKAMDARFRSTFNNYDYENSRIAIAPHSPCPILFGIRATVPDELIDAMRTIKPGEEIERWCIFLTNQATDDHIVKKRIGDCRPGNCVRIRGRVCSEPEVIRGGHVIFRVRDRSGEIDCTIYEPSKEFTIIGRKLATGDVVEVFGAVREIPRTVNVEKLHVVEAKAVRNKQANPQCPVCGKRMKSMGRDAGFVCKRCHVKKGRDEAVWDWIERKSLEGWYEPAVCSRRHLSKPVKLLPNR